MHLSKLIAKMAAVIYLSASLGAFLNPDYYRRLVVDLFSNTGLVYLAGFMTLVIGLLIVSYHNVWAKNWTVIITILGWLALLKGIVLIVCPQYVQRLSECMFTTCGACIFPYSALCLGLVFAYLGFWAAAPPTK